MNSGKAIFVYGAPGAGKTFITQRLARLFEDTCLIPHAIAIGDTVVRVFRPAVHRQSQDNSPVVMLTRGHDPRYVLCQRLLVITGGGAHGGHARVQFDPANSSVPRTAASEGERRHVDSRRPGSPAHSAHHGAEPLDSAHGGRRRLSQHEYRPALPHAVRCDPGVLYQSTAAGSGRRRVPASHWLQDRFSVAESTAISLDLAARLRSAQRALRRRSCAST